MAKKQGRPRHFLREWRLDYPGKPTLEEVADAVGTTHATLSRIERGKIAYTQPILEKLADYYGCAPPDLLKPPFRKAG